MYYIGLDVHKKTISYCVKDGAGHVHREGKIGSTRRELDAWIVTLPGLREQEPPAERHQRTTKPGIRHCAFSRTRPGHLCSPSTKDSHGGRQFGMYGPPPSCKRNVKIADRSAQMYPAFVCAEALDLDGMRCALVLNTFEASESCSGRQVSRAPGSTILPSRCSPADLAENFIEYLSSLVCDWESRSDFQAWRSVPGVNCRPEPLSRSPTVEADRHRF
jgi:hypothetical protein